MTLQQLQYFRVLAQMQHYTHAAEALRVSQPSLSYAMGELEKELGVELFQKRGRGVVLSEAGEMYLEYIAEGLDKLERGRKAMAEYRQERAYSVSVGYIFSLAAQTQKMINSFLQQPGNEEMQVRQFLAHSSSAVSSALVTGKSDVVFCVDPPESAQKLLLQEQELRFAVAKHHPLADREEVTLEELLSHPLILVGDSTSLRSTILRFFSEKGVKPHIGVEAEECNAAAAYAASGEGFALLPASRNFEQNGLTVLNVKDCRVARPVYMAWRDGAQRPAMTQFWRFVCRYHNLSDEVATL